MEKHQFRQLLAERLIELRKEKKLLQKQVAQKISVKTPCYSAYEQGRAEPSLRILKRLCEFYGVELSEMVRVGVGK
jgi:transcriptional regulator with XRE-family HTH domain